MAKLHLILAVLWTLMGIPTILWWKESVLWVAIMSIYTIVLGHIGSYQGARAEDEAKKIEDKLDGKSDSDKQQGPPGRITI